MSGDDTNATEPVDMWGGSRKSSREQKQPATAQAHGASQLSESEQLPPAKRPGKPNGFDVLFGYLGLLFLPIVPLTVGLTFMVATAGDSLLANPEAATVEFTEKLSNHIVFLVFAMLFTWMGLSIGVWTAGRKTAGGWRKLVNWSARWKPDMLFAVGFMVLFMGLQLAAGSLLDLVGVDTSKIGNTDFATGQTGIALVIVFLAASIGAPLFEELFFRGVFYNVVARKWGVGVGIIVSSMGFGLVHVQASFAASLYTCLATGLLGAGLAFLYSRTGRIGTVILAHGLFNAASLTMALAL